MNIADGSIALVSIEGGVPPYTLLWDVLGNLGDTLSNLLPGTYAVTVLDSTGCSIIQALELSAPTANQDVNNLTASFSLWPNPFATSVILSSDELPLKDKMSVAIYNALGSEVLRQPLQSINRKVRQELNLTQLAAGIYFCKVETEGLVLWQGKLVKQ